MDRNQEKMKQKHGQKNCYHDWQRNGSEVYNLKLGWLTLKPHMFLLSLPIKNNKTVFGVKELGATCHKHHPATKSHA